MGDLIGRRRTFVLGVLTFSAASLAGALAQGPLWLVAARALQGMAAAFIAPSALSLLLVAYPEGGERNRALGIWGAVAATGGAAGGVVGGALTEWAGLGVGPVGQRADRPGSRLAGAGCPPAVKR